MNRSTLLTVACLPLLAGCMASGVKHAEMKASMQALKEDQGRIYFYRNSSIFGAAIRPDIKLNGAVVGTSKPGGFFFVDRPAGEYSANASTEVERNVSFALANGETKYVRSSVSMGLLAGRVNFELVNAAEAEGELGSLSYTGPASPPAATEPAPGPPGGPAKQSAAAPAQ
jgi:hypothetical protein